MITVQIDDAKLELYGDAVVCEIIVNGHRLPFAFTVPQWQRIDQFSDRPGLPCGWVQKNGDVRVNARRSENVELATEDEGRGLA